MARGDASRAFDVVVESVGCHSQFFGIETNLTLFPEMLVDELAECVDLRVEPRKRDRASARPACAQSYNFNSSEREQSAHRQAISLTRDRTLFIEICTQHCQAFSLC